MPYEFRKVYLDLITDSGEVCVLYLTWVQLFGRWHAQASLEVYAEGKRSVVHCVDAPPMVDPRRGLDQLPAALTVPGGRLELEVESMHAGWDPVAPCPVPQLEWSVGALRTQATIRIEDKQGSRRYSGTGYLDFVRLTEHTRKLGLRSLRWGRAHMFERSLAYTDLELEDDRRWFVGVTQLHGRPAKSYGNLSFKLEDGAGMVRFGTGGQVLRFKRPELMHDGPAFGPERVPSWLHRQVCGYVGGPTYEKRWRAEARVDHSHGAGSGLHEIVWFGKQARQAARGKLTG